MSRGKYYDGRSAVSYEVTLETSAHDLVGRDPISAATVFTWRRDFLQRDPIFLSAPVLLNTKEPEARLELLYPTLLDQLQIAEPS